VTHEVRPPGLVWGASDRALHLVIFWGFAIAQPAFTVMTETPEFFSVRGLSWPETLLFGLLVVTAPPALLWGIENAIARAGAPKGATRFHIGLIGLLSTGIALQVVKRAETWAESRGLEIGGVFLLACGLILGATVAALYAVTPKVREYLIVLAPAPLVFLAVFAVETNASGADRAHGASRDVPLVMVVFDEMPSLDLMDPSERIDAARFPNFAALARESTWYRRATTVNDSTNYAVPAIVTGRVPRTDQRPIAGDHPANLFTLLGGSHRMNVIEPITSMCPRDLCPLSTAPAPTRMARLLRDAALINLRFAAPHDLESRLPDVPPATRVSGSPEQQVDAFVRALPDEGGPTLSFLHVAMPHQPWSYFPSGLRYAPHGQDLPVAGLGERWLNHPFLTTQGWHRHLLQAGYTDRLLGRILGRLKDTGTYEDSMIVVVADHGMAFQPGRLSRYATRETLAEIASVPLFVKLPGQRGGRISDAPTTTTDVMRIIARELGINGLRLPPATHGVAVGTRNDEVVRMSGAEFQQARADALRRKAEQFGTRTQLADVLVDARPDLHGHTTDDMFASGFERVEFNLDRAGEYDRVDPGHGYVPALLSGQLLLAAGARDREIAIAVNGRVAGTSVGQRTGDEERFSLLVAPGTLSRGKNDIEVFVR
jgi:hypothetical protein